MTWIEEDSYEIALRKSPLAKYVTNYRVEYISWMVEGRIHIIWPGNNAREQSNSAICTHTKTAPCAESPKVITGL